MGTEPGLPGRSRMRPDQPEVGQARPLHSQVGPRTEKPRGWPSLAGPPSLNANVNFTGGLLESMRETNNGNQESLGEMFVSSKYFSIFFFFSYLHGPLFIWAATFI